MEYKTIKDALNRRAKLYRLKAKCIKSGDFRPFGEIICEIKEVNKVIKMFGGERAYRKGQILAKQRLLQGPTLWDQFNKENK